MKIYEKCKKCINYYQHYGIDDGMFSCNNGNLHPIACAHCLVEQNKHKFKENCPYFYENEQAKQKLINKEQLLKTINSMLITLNNIRTYLYKDEVSLDCDELYDYEP